MTPDTAAILRDLARAKVAFQLETIRRRVIEDRPAPTSRASGAGEETT